MIATVTLKPVPTKDRGPAIHNIRDDLGLAGSQDSKQMPELPKNIGHLEHWLAGLGRLVAM